MASQVNTLSIVYGSPLAEEPGMGALTIAGYLREVTQRYADREALVLHTPRDRISWTYGDLWQRSVGVASALIAAGVTKDTRVGILMTNRPEYLSAVFGTAMAGGIAVALSTFSTPTELEHLLKASAVSVLLYERQVLKKDFGAMLGELEPRIATAKPGGLSSEKFPFLRRLVVLDAVTTVSAAPLPDAAIVEPWREFLNGGLGVSAAQVEAFRTATDFAPFRGGVLLKARLGGWSPRSLDLSGLQLKYCSLRKAQLAGASFRGANLSLSNLEGAGLRGCDFSGADLEGASFAGADLRGARMIDVALSATRFYRDYANGKRLAANVEGLQVSNAGGLLESQEAFLRLQATFI